MVQEAPVPQNRDVLVELSRSLRNPVAIEEDADPNVVASEEQAEAARTAHVVEFDPAADYGAPAEKEELPEPAEQREGPQDDDPQPAPAAATDSPVGIKDSVETKMTRGKKAADKPAEDGK